MASVQDRPEACRYFKAPGGCWFGKGCRYYHEGEDPQPERNTARDPNICRYFSTFSGCRFGNRCRFIHAQDMGSDGEKDRSLSPEVETSVNSSVEDRSMRSEEPDSETSGLDSTLEDSPEGHSQKARAEKKEQKKERMAEWKPKDTYSCDECKETFKGKEAYDNVLKHHLDMLCKMEKDHMTFLKSSHWFNKSVVCGACGKDFGRARDLLRHLVDKSKLDKQKEDQEIHHSLLEEVARAFTDRDVGLTTVEESREELLIYLTSHIGPGMGPPADSDDSEDAGLSMGMGLYMLRQMSRWQSGRMTSDNYEDELDERMGNFGFTNDEVDELLCQGIKPWDDCACDALNVLYDC